MVEPGLQVFGDIEAGLIAVALVASHGLFANRYQLGRGVGVKRVDRFRRAVEHPSEDCVRREARARFHVGRLTGEQVVENRAE